MDDEERDRSLGDLEAFAAEHGYVLGLTEALDDPELLEPVFLQAQRSDDDPRGVSLRIQSATDGAIRIMVILRYADLVRLVANPADLG